MFLKLVSSHGGYTDDTIEQHEDKLRMGMTRKPVQMTMSQYNKDRNNTAASNELERLSIQTCHNRLYYKKTKLVFGKCHTKATALWQVSELFQPTSRPS